MPTISGTVTDVNSVGVARLVRAYRKDNGVLQAQTTSSGAGAFSLTVATTLPHTVVAVDATIDPNVYLLLSMDGANNGTVFTDEKGHTITVSSGCTTKTDQFKYGGTSLYIDGTGSLRTTSFPGTVIPGSWTIECWFRGPTGGAVSAEGLWGNRVAASGAALSVTQVAGVLTGLSLQVYETSAFAYLAPSTYAHVGAADTFNHIAITKSFKTYTFWINGYNSGSTTRALQAASGNDAFTIGACDWSYYGYNITGWIDDFRLTQSVIYTADFTPPGRLQAITSYGANSLVFDDVVPA